MSHMSHISLMYSSPVKFLRFPILRGKKKFLQEMAAPPSLPSSPYGPAIKFSLFILTGYKKSSININFKIIFLMAEN